MTKSWLYLIAAGVLEIAWVMGMKYSHSFTRPVPSVFTVVFMALSFFLLSASLKDIPVGTAYAVWTGIGAVGVAALGIILFSEQKDIQRIFFICLIIIGIAGLKLAAK